MSVWSSLRLLRQTFRDLQLACGFCYSLLLLHHLTTLWPLLSSHHFAGAHRACTSASLSAHGEHLAVAPPFHSMACLPPPKLRPSLLTDFPAGDAHEVCRSHRCLKLSFAKVCRAPSPYSDVIKPSSPYLHHLPLSLLQPPPGSCSCPRATTAPATAPLKLFFFRRPARRTCPLHSCPHLLGYNEDGRPRILHAKHFGCSLAAQIQDKT